MPDKDGKHKKMPIDPKTGAPAKSNDPTTWSDFQTAVDAVEKYNCNGVGFMFSNDCGFVGVDIDHCYDPVTKCFNEAATEILALQNTYAEFSPSGTGVHIWYKGTKPSAASRNAATGVEMYDCGRYFTVTGDALEGASETIETALPDTLSWISENYIARKQDNSKTQKQVNTQKHPEQTNTDDTAVEQIDLIEKTGSNKKTC